MDKVQSDVNDDDQDNDEFSFEYKEIWKTLGYNFGAFTVMFDIMEIDDHQVYFV
jgi:hypothetical protein